MKLSLNIAKSLIFSSIVWFSDLVAEEKSPYDFSFEELANIRITPTASLTSIDRNKTPASLTRITREMIDNSGARNISEVLEIFVPGFQVRRSSSRGNVFSLRGIQSDQDNQYLYLVNGIVKNDPIFGAGKTEVLLTLLGDIDYIEVIRGPGGALYGPGAVSGVINVMTKNPVSAKEGLSVSFRQGAIEEFSSLELSYAHLFNSTQGFYLYYGIDKYEGSSAKDSPVYYGTSPFSLPFQRQHGASDGIPSDHQGYRDSYRHKLHMELSDENWFLRLRYTRSGENIYFERLPLLGRLELRENGIGYQQLDFSTGYIEELTDDWQLELRLNYQFTDIESTQPLVNSLFPSLQDRETFNSSLNHQFNGRLLARWQPSTKHALVFGTEYNYFLLNRKSFGWRQEPALTSFELTDPWNTNSLGFVSEYQYSPSEAWSFFVGGRADKHEQTDWLYSPRLAALWQATEKHNFKFIYNRSVRTMNNVILRTNELGNISQEDNEKIDSWEFIWDIQATESLNANISTFYYFYEQTSFDLSVPVELPIGETEVAGLEFELKYKTGDFHMIFSHSWTQLINFKLEQDISDNEISAEPYGAGNDLRNVATHLSKLYISYSATPKLQLTASFRYYWGFPGNKDFSDLFEEQLAENNLPSQMPDNQSFKANAYLNLGMKYSISDQLSCRFDAHNILGWLDKDYNKRNYDLLIYRVEAPALSITLDYTF